MGSMRVSAAVTAAALAVVVAVGPAAISHGNPLSYRTAVVGEFNGYLTGWSGTVPATAAGACIPADPRCDHTLVEVREFEGQVPCVGVRAALAGSTTRAHIAVYRAVPGVPPSGEPLATSDDGTLLFLGEAGALYLISVGRAGLPAPADTAYTAEVGTLDIGFGPGVTSDLDIQSCLPGAWVADTGVGATKAAFDELFG